MWKNYNYVVADTSTGLPNFSVSLNSNVVQSSSSVLTFTMGTGLGLSSSVNYILLKWDNNAIGISGDDIYSLTTSSTCTYLMFKTINLMYVTSYGADPFTCSFSSYTTNDFVYKYGFRFVYANSISLSITVKSEMDSS